MRNENGPGVKFKTKHLSLLLIMVVAMASLFCLSCVERSGPYRSNDPYIQILCANDNYVAHNGNRSFLISFDQQGRAKTQKGNRIFHTWEYQCEFIIRAGDHFYAYGWHGVARSADGLHWERPVKYHRFNNRPSGIAFNGEKYMMSTSTYDVLESRDAYNWQIMAHPPVQYGEYNGVCWNGKTWLLIDDDNIYRAGENGSWETFQSPFYDPKIERNLKYRLEHITKLGDWYFIRTFSGHCGPCAWSKDLLVWYQFPDDKDHIRDMAYNGETYVAVGSFQTGSVVSPIITSNDALTWTQATIDVPQADNQGAGLESIVWDGTQFVAVGMYRCVVTSKDGKQWFLAFRAAPEYYYEYKDNGKSWLKILFK